ncbi:MAG: hypothetical protein PUF41_11305 [Prevotella copri]|nr:hypothetical protein [Segatella copri]
MEIISLCFRKTYWETHPRFIVSECFILNDNTNWSTVRIWCKKHMCNVNIKSLTQCVTKVFGCYLNFSINLTATFQQITFHLQIRYQHP